MCDDDVPDHWRVGEKCLAPCFEDGKLHEGTITSLERDENGKSFAVVSFLESEERKILITKLCKVKDSRGPWKSLIFDESDLEKPYFPDQNIPSRAVAFKLSDNGDYIPYTINRYLRDYQREGAQFLYRHYANKRGCILGDDMGLGKTIQTFLIVAPLSVLYNWKDELDTWGYFKVSVLHGSKKDDDLSRIKQGKCEVALTTYEILRLYLDEFNSIEWSAVIVDEAHRIKNPKAQITQTMKSLKCCVRIGLTGTILQNNMKELWCVMDWAVPGLLGSRVHFKKTFSDPVEHGQRHTATKRELATGRKAMVKLARKMAGWFLRRTKALISDQLPKKEDRMVFCSLTEFQKAVYQAVLETDDVNAHGETIKSLRFSYLMILQKVANHAALLQTDNASKLQEAHIKRVCSQVFSSFPDFVQLSKDAAFETISDPKYSGKMKLLDVLEQYCIASGLDYRRLDGNTKSEDRIRIVREFNRIQEINICLVSTMAGGLGLNFVGANVVILFDPTWNPANDLQAIDRAYRIGQHRAVKVFRLISLGTVEEIMYLRQVYKQREGQVEAGVMTAATWLKEENHSCSSGKYEQPDCQEDGDPQNIQAQLKREETDFWDDFSDDDILESSVKKSDGRKPYNENNFMVLRRKAAEKNEDQGISKQCDIVMETESSSEADDDVIFPTQVQVCRQPVLAEEVEILSSISENCGELAKEKAGFVFKGNSRQFGFHSTESNFSNAMSFEDVKNDIDLKGASDISDESDDIELSHNSESRKLGTLNFPKWKRCALNNELDNVSKSLLQAKKPHRKRKESGSENIDEFSSSEDNFPVEKIHAKKQSCRCEQQRGRVQFESKMLCPIQDTSVTQTKSSNYAMHRTCASETEFDHQEKKMESMDKYLDGVQEVAYIHSNQHVVGSSKAENHLSRCAVRDVFELKQFSQLPANVAVCSAKGWGIVVPIQSLYLDLSHWDRGENKMENNQQDEMKQFYYSERKKQAEICTCKS
ncbi:hypothetical protein DUI87_03683 [Hirundo rustica rustica]|uniref:DNA excision repair protein ERCC-6-like 2 n=1 Tax=Hirundo rustica rustica TaxID=333673 RepID=A0A3M0L0R5_HIRRU|nr:hypothetical protein DUI87_03683 [Hirundo rustica rustica]